MFIFNPRIIKIHVLLVFALAIASGFEVTAQSSANYKMERDVLDAAGVFSTSMNYKLEDAVGQPSAIGNSSSSNYELLTGYLANFLSANLGDVNGDDLCNSTDALIVLSYDVGLTIPPDFLARINAGFGDVNTDQLTNSTDALIILSFDAGINVPFPICQPFNPPNAPTVYSEVEKSIGGKIEVTANPVIAEITRGMTVEIPVNIDVSALGLKLGSYTAAIKWDNTSLKFESVEGGTTKGFDRPAVNIKGTDKGKLVFSSAAPEGAKGKVNVLNLKLKVIGKSGERSAVKLSFTSMAAAKTFENLLPYLESKQDNNSLVSVGSNPTEYGLDNYPNPFNPTTKISYSLPVAGSVKITIYNTLGQQVRVLVNQEQQAGQYNVEWNSRNDHNQTLSSGVYILRMQVAEFIETKKMVLMK